MRVRNLEPVGAAPEHSVERIAVLRAELPPCNLVDGERRHDVDALALRSSIRSRRRGGEGAGAGHVGRHSRRLRAVAAVLAGAPKALETGALGFGELGFVFPLCRLPATPSCSNDPPAFRYGRKMEGPQTIFSSH